LKEKKKRAILLQFLANRIQLLASFSLFRGWSVFRLELIIVSFRVFCPHVLARKVLWLLTAEIPNQRSDNDR
jgi:hydrogenase-4 membrane subunit HyfE